MDNGDVLGGEVNSLFVVGYGLFFGYQLIVGYLLCIN